MLSVCWFVGYGQEHVEPQAVINMGLRKRGRSEDLGAGGQVRQKGGFCTPWQGISSFIFIFGWHLATRTAAEARRVLFWGLGCYTAACAGSMGAAFVPGTPTFRVDSAEVLDVVRNSHKIRARQGLIDLMCDVYSCKEVPRDRMERAFAPNVTFEDPAVSLVGLAEVMLSLRALKYLDGSASTVLAVTHYNSGASIDVQQRWRIPIFGRFVLKETLFLEFCGETELDELGETTAQVSRIYDLWNRKRLVPLFHVFPRRLNGFCIAAELKLMERWEPMDSGKKQR
ncbi:hypothetical protein FVE85_9059 [Porphyridium purpureum]|uniref:Uncharacterized protein n=1 Tax=Porphyridium purpureum TaxID=35688 RepID=A0A5J4YQW5_PORPP|nr:hypothetical protein FVE85_9059 [Porphyridium purpureum]|eukprot:POR7898..scf222_8